MADKVFQFKERLFTGDMKALGSMLHQAWLGKKTLARHTSNNILDSLYESGMKHGAWGGKVLGAGGGGCLLFVVPPEKKKGLQKSLEEVARKNGLSDYQIIPFHFVQSGSEVLYNGDHFNKEIISSLP